MLQEHRMYEIMSAGTHQNVCVIDKGKMTEKYDPKTTGHMSLGARSSIIVDINDVSYLLM